MPTPHQDLEAILTSPKQRPHGVLTGRTALPAIACFGANPVSKLDSEQRPICDEVPKTAHHVRGGDASNHASDRLSTGMAARFTSKLDLWFKLLGR